MLPRFSRQVCFNEDTDMVAHHSRMQRTVPRSQARQASLLKDQIGSSMHSLGSQLKHH